MSQIIKPRLPTINFSHPDAKGVIFDTLLTEGAGGMVQDSVTKVSASSTVGAPTWQIGQYGKQLVLDGASAIGFPAGFLQTVTAFTVMALIYPTLNAQIGAIFGSDRNGGIEFRLNNNNLDLVKENVVDIGGSTGTIPLNVWSLVAVTYDTSGVYIFYNNAINIGSGTNLQVFSSFIPQIGHNNPTSNERFNGSIALIREYNYALPGKQIKRITANPFAIYQQPLFPYANSIAQAIYNKILMSNQSVNRSNIY